MKKFLRSHFSTFFKSIVSEMTSENVFSFLNKLTFIDAHKFVLMLTMNRFVVKDEKSRRRIQTNNIIAGLANDDSNERTTPIKEERQR